MLGAAVVRQLAAAGYTVVSVDIAPPPATRTVAGVVYIVSDLATAFPHTTKRLQEAFAGCTAVVHTAGVVRMGHDANSETLLHNAHVVATRNVIHHAKTSGCTALVFTSSVCFSSLSFFCFLDGGCVFFPRLF